MLFALSPLSLTAADLPNILIIMADDCTHSDLPVYGGQNAKTPHIDALARQGLVFNRAYLAEAMCQPCRAELYSGLYPMSNGCAWNHSASRPDLLTMPQQLSSVGYRVGLAGKVHVKPASSFPFEKIGGFDPNCVRNPTRPHDVSSIRDFMTRDQEQPFCLVVALVEPHVPWVMGDASQYPPDSIELPPNIADTARTRVDFGRYLAEITYMDSQVGEILTTLETAGGTEDTLVLFTSEQGSQFPGCKWTNWDTGVHTAFIARWPGMVADGHRTDAIVQYADVLPTLMAIAGSEAKSDVNADVGSNVGSDVGADQREAGSSRHFDGTSFLPVLLSEKNTHRQFAYGVHNNIPEGPAYPTRTITDGSFRYIQNLRPDDLYIEKHLMGMTGGGGLNNPYWATWIAEAWNHPRTLKLVKRYMSRPAEEFYHTAEDPYEMKNLAQDPEYALVKQKLRRELEAWLASQGDPGIPQDTMAAIQAARQGKHQYGPHVSAAD